MKCNEEFVEIGKYLMANTITIHEMLTETYIIRNNTGECTMIFQ